MEELHSKQSDKRTFGLLLQAIFCAIPLIKDSEVCRSAICKKLLCNDKWTTYKIQDIAEIGRGRVISSVEIDRQKHPLYPVYSSQTSNDGIMGYLDNYMFDGEYITWTTDGANGIVGYLDNYNTEGEAVYIIKDGSGVGTVSYVMGKCSATGTLNTLQAKEGYSLQYIYYILKVFNFEPYKTGMAIPHIYFKDYGKGKVYCPSYTKQLQSARLLSAIDNKLSVEKDILTNLTLQKQYLLRQLFI